MKTTRLIAGLTSAGLLGLAPLALAAPANATENLTTTVELSAYSNAVTYGDKLSGLNGKVTTSKGTSAYKGTVTLYSASSKDATWVPVTTVPASGYMSFGDIKPKTNSMYKAVFSGYAATTTYEDNLAASESAPFAIAVQRKVKIKTNKLWLNGKVTPQFKKKKVVLKRKQGKKFVKWRTVKTNKKGAFRVKAPNRRGFQFTVTIPTDKHYTGWTSGYRVY
ncbi:hypothetical protein [Nocardioides campestrisoli]|uniref:hypothetical protein n=1 Tax=Nocardioides campestrisoli TaxID=2736757 RepID=UPI0015E638AD|nr:hypothetical protein [Nocardioides campestrisoli]